MLQIPPPVSIPLGDPLRIEYRVTPQGPSDGPRTVRGKELERQLKALVGTPYLYGGRTLKAMDSSGAVQYAFAKCFIPLPLGSTNMANAKFGQVVTSGPLRFGDVLYIEKPNRHVFVYMGGGQVFSQSPPSGTIHSMVGPKVAAFWSKPKIVRRFLTP